LSLSKAGAFFSSVTLLSGLGAAAAQGPSSTCTALLQAQDAKAVAACKAQVDEAESGPATERMARIVADDEYGVALLAIAHQPKQALDAFDSGIALLPASTVKPDSLQWAVAFWHRATAYQQLGQWEQAAGDLGTAQDTLTKAIAAAVGNAPLAQHLTQLRQRVHWDSWCYLTHPNYKSAGRILHQLIDVVSKNGNLLLDVGPRPDGTIPAEIESRLHQIGAWLKVNGEAIYETRPADRFGEGPTQVKKGSYVADHTQDFTAQDIRFTTRPRALYVHVLGAPGAQVRVASLKRDTPLPFGTLRNAELLGSPPPLRWEWSPDGLVLHMPESRPSEDALVIKLT
jgi:tetratricopeptide (TPR) repeat protein